MSNNNNKKKKYYTARRDAYATTPEDVHGIWNDRTSFWYDELRKKLFGVVNVDTTSEWDKDYIRDALLIRGVFTVTKDNNGILLPLRCNAHGVNVFNRATNATIANPVVGSFERTVGEDCELVYLEQRRSSRFTNFNKMLWIYAQRLANCDASIDVNITNCKTPQIFKAANNNVAESFKAMYDEISKGNPAVFVDESIGTLTTGSESDMFMLKVKESFIADVIQNEKCAIMNEFLTMIGINTANTTKRERMVTDEVNSNNIDVKNNIKLFKENVEDCLKRVKKLFPECDLTITFPYWEEMEELDDDNNVNVDNGESEVKDGQNEPS